MSNHHRLNICPAQNPSELPNHSLLKNTPNKSYVDKLQNANLKFNLVRIKENTTANTRLGRPDCGDGGDFALRFKINVWGAFDLRLSDGQCIRPTVRKSCALLAILALSEGHRQTRKWLQAQLWSESDEVQSAGSLRQELARLKRLLGNAIQSDRIDIWLDSKQFEFDHLCLKPRNKGVELLQGIDIQDEGFEDWLREQRQLHYEIELTSDAVVSKNITEQLIDLNVIQPQDSAQQCTVIFDCSAKGSLEADVAAMFFSEQLYRKLSQYELFTCIGNDADGIPDTAAVGKASKSAVVIRIIAFANRDEVCLGVQIDSGQLGPRLGYDSVVLPRTLSRLQEAPEIGRLVQTTTDTLLDRLRYEALPTGGTAEATLLVHEARKQTFALDRKNLIKADLLLTRAYELEPRGQYLAWRAFLRNTAFFQHQTSDIFQEQYSSDELSLEAMRQAPENALVQAFSSQIDYVNQGSLMEQMVRLECAVELDRSDPLARAFLSNALTVNGRLEDAYQVALQSVSLVAGGRYEFYFHHFACMAATAAGRCETALGHARKSVSFMPNFVSPRRYEVALAVELGDQSGVERAVTAMRTVEPEFNVKTLLTPGYPVNTLRRLPLIEAIR